VGAARDQGVQRDDPEVVDMADSGAPVCVVVERFATVGTVGVPMSAAEDLPERRPGVMVSRAEDVGRN
jgi:hypothetical protein